MLKTYRIIPSAFILFLFGLTLITVSPVSAQDSPEFMACKQIKPRGNFKLMKQKKNCFRDVARLFQGQSGPAQPVAPIDPSGGEVAQLNNRIAELEGQLSAAAASQGPLTALVAELEGQLTAATAAQGPLNAKVAELEGQLADAVRSQDHYMKVNATLTQQLSEAQSQNSEPAGRTRQQSAGLRCGTHDGFVCAYTYNEVISWRNCSGTCVQKYCFCRKWPFGKKRRYNCNGKMQDTKC